jgi:DNA-binding PadR family transcriptional regulator
MSRPFGRGGPQGAPRGLLVYWVLHRISVRPTYGFEILREIESKTDGAWRPGPGSVYPLLKKLASRGFIASEKTRGDRVDQRLYRITDKGAKHLGEARELFRTMAKRWGAMRGIYTDLVGTDETQAFLLEGARNHFEAAKAVLEKNQASLSEQESRTVLKEYAVLLEGQLEWAKKTLAGRGRATEAPSAA